MRGPAIMPSFVTCPMMTTAIEFDLANRTSSAVHSRNWETPPALPATPPDCTV